MPKKLYYNYYFFKGHWENKNLEKGEQNGLSNNYFLHQRYKKTARTTVMASRLWLAAYIVRLFDSHFSLVYFSGLKYILAAKFSILGRKMPDRVIMMYDISKSLMSNLFDWFRHIFSSSRSDLHGHDYLQQGYASNGSVCDPVQQEQV